MRPRTARPAAIAASLSCAILLSSCAFARIPDEVHDPVTHDPIGYSKEEPRLPLPSGAYLERPGVSIEGAMTVGNPVGSLRPDGRTPKERVPEIVKRDRLIVGVDQSQNLLSYRAPATGEFSGFEADIAREIAFDILGDRRKVDFRYIDSATRTTALRNKDVDMVIRTMTITEARQENVAFSTPYLTASARLLVPTDSQVQSVDDLDGKTVCVTQGSMSVDLARLEAPNATRLITRSWADCLMAMQQHQTDAILSDDVILSGMAAQDSYTKIVGEPMTTYDYGITMRKSSPEENTDGLVRQVNSTIERIRVDGTWQRLYNQSLGNYLAPENPPQPFYRDEENTQ